MMVLLEMRESKHDKQTNKHRKFSFFEMKRPGDEDKSQGWGNVGPRKQLQQGPHGAPLISPQP